MEELQKDLDEWMQYYKNERTHQGLCAMGEHSWKHCLIESRFGQKKIRLKPNLTDILKNRKLSDQA